MTAFSFSMQKHFEDLLYARYPDIFQERTRPPAASTMAWGCACNDGWFAIIDAVCDRIADAVAQGAMPAVSFLQVKEKTGSLRIRFTGGDARTWTLVRLAEALSVRVCEACGAPTEVRDARDSRTSRLCSTCNEALPNL